MIEQETRGVHASLDELISLRASSRDLSLVKNNKPKTLRVGSHLSASKGRGMDFEEVRVYRPGDDVRNMDWRVTARTNVPHIKVFREERERPVFLVVDFTETMFFGTRAAFKSVVAARVAAILAWATVASGDRVGAVLFSEHDMVEIKPGARDRSALRILKQLSDFTKSSQPIVGRHPGFEPGQPRHPGLDPGSSINKALTTLNRIAPSGSLIFLLSDFESFDEQALQQYKRLAQSNQIISGLIYDPLEAEPPKPGLYQFSDGAQKILLNTATKSLCEQYRAQFAQKVKLLEQEATTAGQSFFQLRTNQPILPVLREVLQHAGGTHK